MLLTELQESALDAMQDLYKPNLNDSEPPIDYPLDNPSDLTQRS